MNNFYVDELPKRCDDCPFYKLDTYIDINDVTRNSYECVLEGSMLTGDCPLKPLSDRLAEERKKVVQEIRDIARKIARPTTEYDDKTFDYDIDAIEFDNLLLWFQNGKQDFVKTYLDQIERGE